MPSISWQCSFSFEKCAVFTQRHLIKLRASGFVFPCINLAFNTCLCSSRLRRKVSIAFRSETSVNAHLKWIYFHVTSFFYLFLVNKCLSIITSTIWILFFGNTRGHTHSNYIKWILWTKKNRVFSFLCNYSSFWEKDQLCDGCVPIFAIHVHKTYFLFLSTKKNNIEINANLVQLIVVAINPIIA